MTKFKHIKSQDNLLVVKPVSKDYLLKDVLELIPDTHRINHIRWLDGDFWVVEFHPIGSVLLTTNQWDVIKEYERTAEASTKYNPSMEKVKFVASLFALTVLTVMAFH